MLVKEWQTQMQAAVTFEKNRNSHEKVWCEGNELVSTLKHPGKHYQYTRNAFESSESYTVYMTMLSRQNMVNTIFGCMWQKCYTLANLGWMYLCDFYTIFKKCYCEYILFKNCDKNWGSSGLFRSYSAKCKHQSQLRKLVNTTRRYVLRKKFLNLSLC